MGIEIIIAIAFGLALDAFAVSIACSVILQRVSARQVFRLAFHFGLFQALMPILGWLAGRTMYQYISLWDHWLAFLLLTAVGGKAIISALRGTDCVERISDPTKGFCLLTLSIATSIDALAVGLSFAFLEIQVWYASAIIGLVTFVLTVVGMIGGSGLGLRFGKRMEIVGGVVLIAIGFKILLEHLLGA